MQCLAEKAYETSQERDQLLAHLAAAEGLRAKDVAWILFRPDRAYRDAVVAVLRRLADPDTVDRSSPSARASPRRRCAPPRARFPPCACPAPSSAWPSSPSTARASRRRSSRCAFLTCLAGTPVDGWARDRALESMRAFGADLLEPTVELLSDPDQEVRASALIVAQSFEDPRTVPATIGLLKDPDWWIRITPARPSGG